MKKKPQWIEFGGRRYKPDRNTVVVQASFAEEKDGKERSFTPSVLQALVGVRIETCLNPSRLGLKEEVGTLLASAGDLIRALMNARKVEAAQELFAECGNDASMMVRFPPGTYR